MEYLNSIIYYISLMIFVIMACQACYLFIFSSAGRIFSAKKMARSENNGSFAIYIPSYKEDAVIVETAEAALNIDYPQKYKKVIVIADSLQPETLHKLKLLPIQVVEGAFEKSTKAKALNTALQQTEGDFDYALILDADNICAQDFLYRMNDVFQNGFSVVQGQRVAKNTNTAFALLDTISEAINNHIFRKGHRALGFSCAIIGSGMALSYHLFKEIMPEITAVGGFDKEMELRLLKRRIKFAYAEDAIVYDEKTAHQNTFENQRRRWLSAQVHYLKKYFLEGFRQLAKGNIDFFDKVLQTLLLPRILLLGITPLLFFCALIPGPGLPYTYWLGLWIVTYFAILLAIPAKYFNKHLLKAIFSLPRAFGSMFMLFFKLKGANKTFIHTPHSHTTGKV